MNMQKITLNCTILIPTYNRPKYLKRLLEYYNKYTKYKFSIFVADSSSEENKKINKENILIFSNLNLKYLEFPDKITLFDKLLSTLSQIKTEYCVICADDDFILVSGLESSLEFLNNNLEYAIAHGNYISFYIKDKDNIYWNNTYNTAPSSSSDPLERFRVHVSTYPSPPTFYAVHRTDFIKKIFKMVTSSGISSTILLELYFAGLSSIHSKIEILDIFYSMKNTNYLREEYIPNVNEVINNNLYSDEYDKFIKLLSLELSKKTNIQLETSEEIIIECLNIYINNTFKPNSVKRKELFYKLKLKMIYEIGRKLFRKFIPRKQYLFSPDKLPKQYVDEFYSVIKVCLNENS